MSKSAEDYREEARRARALADKAAARERQTLLDIAKLYDDLARQVGAVIEFRRK